MDNYYYLDDPFKLKIMREGQKHIIVSSFLISWQITPLIKINPWSFNIYFLTPIKIKLKENRSKF